MNFTIMLINIHKYVSLMGNQLINRAIQNAFKRRGLPSFFFQKKRAIGYDSNSFERKANRFYTLP